MPHLPHSRLLSPRIGLFGRRVSSFQVCGGTGLAVATALISVLAWHRDLSPFVVAGLLASGLVTALALAMATKILTGREALVYYHHEIAILAISATLLHVMGVPALPYLDLNALWLGTFLVFGRQGCLMVGCCHGRPHRWGVRYSDAHAREGFPEWYVGVRLFPIQTLESSIVAAIVVAGTVMVWRGDPAGDALGFYVMSYCAARIWLEELRGDAARPYWGRFSEAQWTSALLMALVLVAEWQGRLPRSQWHLGVGLVSALGLVVLALRGRTRRRILAPGHADELASLIRGLARSPSNGSVTVLRTSQAFGVSTQSLGSPTGHAAVHYCLSHAGRALEPGEALVLSELIANLAGARGMRDLIRGSRGIYHLLVREGPR